MPLTLNKSREISLLLTGIGLLVAAVYVDHHDNEPVFSPYREGYTGDEINPIDRLGYTARDERAGQFADAGLWGGPTLPLLLSLDPRTRPHYPVVLLLWLQTMLLTFSLSSLIKNTVSRPRPYIYNENWELEQRLTRKDRAAFLSGHAANATAGSVLFASLLATYDHRFARHAKFAAITISCGTAYLRVKAGKHWITDAAAGILLGGGVAGAVINWHKAKPGKPV
ncbi:membrane-associated phospholipid phosphatase [Lewinella aquimaris]|uniref:Membrane-associated phospholipid phosphatase n=1 Tax=Neolewinella aquimaris TaxID=1835722 RepID=A0A840E2F7_9BACT|nr:phosphatase PAP2 family protein [Neolewinella aquimaris]MBB4079280.1 membrane-associated phospholipid phosphatase [Neolewinella aquimaris]